MTISSTTAKVSYAGNGVTTAFAFAYPYQATSHLEVTLVVDSTGVETVKTETTHYTVSAAGASGTVTMLTAPATGETLVITRKPPITQAVDLVSNDAFPPQSVEDALDKLTHVAQNLQEQLTRTPKFRRATAQSNPEIDELTDKAGYVLSVNDDEDGFELVEAIGETGATGATGAAGTSFTWRGAYAGGTSYVANDVVSYSGSSYICILASTGNLPTNGTYWSVVAAQGASGAGTGDLIAANNLSDVADAATAFGTIKQAATTSATGVVELATLAETITGTDTARAVTPAGAAAAYQPLDADLTAVAGLAATTGMLSRTGAGAFTARTITGTSNRVTVTNGDGASGNPTLTLPDTAVTPGSYTNTSLTVTADGRITAASSGSGSAGWSLITASDPSAVAALDFTSGISSTYQAYRLIGHLLPATDNVILYFRVSTDAGSTFKSGASDYAYSVTGAYASADATATAIQDGDSAHTAIAITGSVVGIGNASTEGVDFDITIYDPASAALHKRTAGTFAYSNTTSQAGGGVFSGAYLAATAVNGFRLLFSSGNIASGHVALFGIQKS